MNKNVAIARLPSESRRQLVQDIPALCPDAFPVDGYKRRFFTPPRRYPALTPHLDKLDAG
jgi:hypothetical protein